MVTSDYLLAEIVCQPDSVRRSDVLILTAPAAFHLVQREDVDARATSLAAHGIQGFDALHLAAAESTGCDFLLTTDDRFEKRCQRAQNFLKTQTLNPLAFLPYFK